VPAPEENAETPRPVRHRPRPGPRPPAHRLRGGRRRRPDERADDERAPHLPPDRRARHGQSFIGTVLADIGLDQLELPAGQSPTYAALAAEEIIRADADIVLYSSFGPADASGEDAVVAGPLWSRVGAVADGRAPAVEDDISYTGTGLRAAMLQLEELRELLVD
jgi:ABC-type Fe3+-hydroxamate transport system substrate-binding protein